MNKVILGPVAAFMCAWMFTSLASVLWIIAKVFVDIKSEESRTRVSNKRIRVSRDLTESVHPLQLLMTRNKSPPPQRTQSVPIVTTTGTSIPMSISLLA